NEWSILWGGRTQPLTILGFVILTEITVLNFAPPPLVITVPDGRLDDSFLGGMIRFPSQVSDLGDIQAIAAVMTRPIYDVPNQASRPVQCVKDDFDHFQILDLYTCSNIVDLTDIPPMQNEVDSFAVIPHMLI